MSQRFTCYQWRYVPMPRAARRLFCESHCPTTIFRLLAPSPQREGASIHRCKAVKQFTSKPGAGRIHLERLPAYAPELNPQEGVWNLLKRVELKNVCCLDLQHVQREVRRAKERLRHRKSTLSQCYAHAGYSL